MQAADIKATITEEDQLRADLYNFLGLILAKAPDDNLLAQVAGLTGDDTDLGKGITALARIGRITNPADAEREFNALFIGLGRGELLPYASYYLTGFLNEKPLAVLRQEMADRRITRSKDESDPEDKISTLMEIMSGLITGRFGSPATLESQKLFFDRHIGPWAGHFFSDLETAKSSVFYAAVGVVGKAFMEVEQEAFRMTTA
ncbi:TorD/DmsD family molecular chaperone [Coralliovum pocilloporae]|uniref:TorD/DmsD family molecular chaperone n=1 Tax=Coralliovum pocilloporae TaxID=3066369 RepID=UPI00330760C7